MTGSRLLLTPRDRQVLVEVSRFGAMTRAQLIRLGLFNSKTRANARLKKLTAAGYLASRAQPLLQGGPRLVYGPGRLVPSTRYQRTRLAASGLFLSHQLGLVDIQLAFEQRVRVIRWRADKELSALSLGLSPDAFVEFEVNGLSYCAFVEYDRGTETLGRVELKIRKYLDLAHTGRFERILGRRFFRVAVIGDTPGRLASLASAVAVVTDRMVRLALLSAVTEHGPLGSIWHRPGRSTLQSLTSV